MARTGEGDLPEGFYAGELYCYRHGPEKDATFGYIPGQPHVEIRSGSPVASLMTSPGAAVLSLEAVWSAAPDALVAAQREIEKRYPNLEQPRLRIAELSDTTASLTINGVDGASFTFGPNPTSGTGSYRVVFSETLKTTEKPAALDALRGRAGVLELSYAGTLTLRETVSVRLVGDLAEHLKALAPKKVEKRGGGFFGRRRESPEPAPVFPDLAACAVAVDGALSAARLKITRDETPNVSAALRTKVETELRTSVAQQLVDKIRELGEDAIYMSSFSVDQTTAESEHVRYRITRVADLAACFADNKGAGLIAAAGVAIPEPRR